MTAPGKILNNNKPESPKVRKCNWKAVFCYCLEILAFCYIFCMCFMIGYYWAGPRQICDGIDIKPNATKPIPVNATLPVEEDFRMELDYDAPFRAVVYIDPNASEIGDIAAPGNPTVIANIHAQTQGRVLKIRFSPIDQSYSGTTGEGANGTAYSFGQDRDYIRESRAAVANTIVTIRLRSLMKIVNRSPKDMLLSSPITAKHLTFTSFGPGGIIVPDITFADQLSVFHAGHGLIRVTGDCRTLLVMQMGSGGLDAGTLQSETGQVFSTGSGETRVSVSSQLGIFMTGSGSVFYRGTPQVNLLNTGTGQVGAFQIRT